MTSFFLLIFSALAFIFCLQEWWPLKTFTHLNYNWSYKKKKNEKALLNSTAADIAYWSSWWRVNISERKMDSCLFKLTWLNWFCWEIINIECLNYSNNVVPFSYHYYPFRSDLRFSEIKLLKIVWKYQADIAFHS